MVFLTNSIIPGSEIFKALNVKIKIIYFSEMFNIQYVIFSVNLIIKIILFKKKTECRPLVNFLKNDDQIKAFGQNQ